jgi:D-alanyl-D-alanine carboxypeptidase (penicillin-binding protein 5/6)
MSSDRERSEESRKLLDWGMRSFQRTELFGDGEVVTNVTVYGGARSTVPLKAKGPISVLVPMTNRDRLSARVVYDGPIMAPIEEGTQIGTLRISVGDTLSQETPLYAAETIGLGTLQQRAIDAAGELLVGWLR